MMKLYHSTTGPVIESDGAFYRLVRTTWDELFHHNDLAAFLAKRLEELKPAPFEMRTVTAPIGLQEVWAAGVTYYRSRDARMEEAKQAGGGSFYDRVYEAPRPELFMKATPHRVVGHGQPVRIRADSKWNVPEPELTLAVSAGGKIIGYTIGNDMSSRDIEGENPLYLPQAKVYNASAALGPGVLVTNQALDKTTAIELEIVRQRQKVFAGRTTIAEIKRPLESLVEYLFRDNGFPNGCYLMTGTGIVPPSDFTLAHGDEVRITIAPIGTLVNPVA